MAKITYFTKAGEQIQLNAESGNVMKLAVDNDVPGIEGACGGVCSCATCHVHVDPTFSEKVGQASEIETDILELDDNYTEQSRLGCQIKITSELDGLTVRVVNE